MVGIQSGDPSAARWKLVEAGGIFWKSYALYSHQSVCLCIQPDFYFTFVSTIHDLNIINIGTCFTRCATAIIWFFLSARRSTLLWSMLPYNQFMSIKKAMKAIVNL